MNDFEMPTDINTPAEGISPNPAIDAGITSPAGEEKPSVNPIRSAAGRLGALRLRRLTELGREYERDHDLTPGRQRLRQLVQLGLRYEVEHGLRTPKAKRRGDPWAEFLAALARVVKPAHRPAVEKLAAALAGESTDATGQAA